MVSPVLANDGVSVLKAQNSSTQTTKEGTKTIKLHVFKDGKEEPNPIDVEVPANADVFEVMNIIANNYVPTGYALMEEVALQVFIILRKMKTYGICI